MRLRLGLTAALIGSVIAGAGQAGAQQNAPAQAGSAATASPALPAQVKQGLDRMGTALRALTAFKLVADVTTEDVLETGQKLQSSSLMTFDVHRPNRMLVNIDSERKNRRLYYDGKNLTVFSPHTGYYATVAAPSTIIATIRELADRYAVETPLADLFEWGTSAFPTDRIKSAIYAGSDRVRGKTCDQYAFRQDDVDWQVWVSREQPALPCKLVITNTDDETQPQTVALFAWTPNVQLSDAQFHFVPPANARRIVLEQASSVLAKDGSK